MLTAAEHDGILFWGDEICQDRRERKAKAEFTISCSGVSTNSRFSGNSQVSV